MSSIYCVPPICQAVEFFFFCNYTKCLQKLQTILSSMLKTLKFRGLNNLSKGMQQVNSLV